MQPFLIRRETFFFINSFYKSHLQLNEINGDKLTGQHYYNKSRYEYRLANEDRNLDALKSCVQKDPNMAIGFFQLAVTEHELKLFDGMYIGGNEIELKTNQVYTHFGTYLNNTMHF